MLYKIYLTRIANKWLKRKDGSTLLVKVVPNFEQQYFAPENGILEYLLFKEDYGMLDILFTDPVSGRVTTEAPYLGRILFDANNNWVYDGNVLTVFEEEMVAEFICNAEV